MPKTTEPKISLKRSDTDSKKHNNTTHFFKVDDNLHNKVFNYISSGLDNNETCIVIATPATVIKLNKRLRDSGFDLDQLIDCESYITLDAEEILDSIMVDSLLDPERFMISLGSLMKIASGKERPIRTFAELVTLLAEDKNIAGIKSLVANWDTLISKFDFTLYCAYPDMT